MVKQKLIAYLLAFAMLINAFGSMLVYLELRAVFKASFAERLLHGGKDAPTVTISSREIRLHGMRIEDGREIIHGERYYDIVSVRTEASETFYLCVPDEAESRLEAHFISVFESGNCSARGTQPVKNSIKNIVQEGMNPVLPVSGISGYSESQYGLTDLKELLPLPALVPTPPPEAC